MKKMTSLCLIGLAISTVLSGYPQRVHQHIVTQAKNLLILEFSHINFSTFSTYVGNENEYGDFSWEGNEPVCSEDWRNPYINAGVWREDCSNPYFTDWNNIAELFNSHFWNSNAGDNSYGLPMGNENYLNAYQKAMVYVDGGIEFDLWYGDNGGGYTLVFPFVNSQYTLTINCHIA